MDDAAVKAFCEQLPGAREEYPFGPETTVYKVEGKIFAIAQLTREPLRVSLRCDPELAPQLRAAHAAIAPGWHLNKRHWNTVTLDGSLPDEMVRELIEDSYDLVVASLSRAKRAALGWPGDSSASSASSS